MEANGYYWDADEYGIAAEAQFLEAADSLGYSPKYFGGHHRSKDVEITVRGTLQTVDVKAGFPWPSQRIGFMGRKAGVQIRAGYLGLVVHSREERSRLYGDRLEFPAHDGIYLIPSPTVEELFTRDITRAGTLGKGLNVYAQFPALAGYKIG